MRKSKFTENKIVATLKQVEGGRQVKDVCRDLGIAQAIYYAWKSKYGGMDASDGVVDGSPRMEQASGLFGDGTVAINGALPAPAESRRCAPDGCFRLCTQSSQV